MRSSRVLPWLVVLGLGGLLAPSPGLAQDAGWYEALPPSPNAPFLPDAWVFSVSAQNNAQSDWLGLDEKQVFFRRLTHQQSGADWTIKVGKGGQIFSISTPPTGELIAPQRITHGQWIDEVFQHTLPSQFHVRTEDSGTVDGDIHQAGYYTKSDLDAGWQVIPQSVYSPTFSETLMEFRQAEAALALITWPQHAHLPRVYTENGMLMHQLTRDLGDGVVEITLEVDKWLGEETVLVSTPWSGFRTATVPAALISRPDGSYQREDVTFSSGVGRRRLTDQDTGGWMALAQSAQPDAGGVGIVFGQQPRPADGATGYLRWGQYGAGDEKGTAVTVKRDLPLRPGDSVFVRYFLVIGSLAKIQHYGNLLESRVEVGRIRRAERQAGLIWVCPDPTDGLRRGCPDGGTGSFATLRDFLPDSVPLFLLKSQAGAALLTADPYELSFDPTDGRTGYVEFLGWALPAAHVELPCLQYRSVVDATDGLGVQVSATLAGAKVRTTTGFWPAGTVCDDGDPCTTGETCQAGVCRAPEEPSCPPASDSGSPEQPNPDAGGSEVPPPRPGCGCAEAGGGLGGAAVALLVLAQLPRRRRRAA